MLLCVLQKFPNQHWLACSTTAQRKQEIAGSNQLHFFLDRRARSGILRVDGNHKHKQQGEALMTNPNETQELLSIKLPDGKYVRQGGYDPNGDYAPQDWFLFSPTGQCAYLGEQPREALRQLLWLHPTGR
jgi:hypothetical protein